MKCLILDSETSGIISLIFSQSEILEFEIFLVERLDKVKNIQFFCGLRIWNFGILDDSQVIP
jgi:hypothetical protein